MMLKPSSGGPPAAVSLTSAAAISSPAVEDVSVCGVRMIGLAMMSAITSANSCSFEPK